MEVIFTASLALGLVAGLLAGLFGIGGGLVIVPVLAVLFKQQGFDQTVILLVAVATSLATIVLTAVSSVWAHHRLGAVLWPKVWRLAPMIIVGSALGAVIAKNLPTTLFRWVLIIFLVYVGLEMAMPFKPKPGQQPQSRWLDGLAGALIGAMSAVVGIGGGTLTVPYLVYGQTPMRNAVAISSACGLPIALAGTLSYGYLGWDVAGLPPGNLGYVNLPAFFGVGLTSIFTAPLGALLANRLPAAQLKRYFAALLWLMAAKLLWF